MLNYILHNLDRYPLDGVVHFELEIDYPFIHNVIDYMETECKRAGIQFVRIKPRKTWEELYDKCGFPTRKIRNATEAKGHIVTSVVELCEDGSTPRVAFRNTKEYRAAKQVQDSVSTPTRIERIRAMDKFHLGVLLNDIRHEPQKYPECHMAWIDWLNGQPKGTIIGKNF